MIIDIKLILFMFTLLLVSFIAKRTNKRKEKIKKKIRKKIFFP